MSGLPLGLIVETGVAILLATTIGYCMVLNVRLGRLRTDREQLQKMVADLVGATELANRAISGLREAAQECDLTLSARLDAAERFSIDLAHHVTAGQAVMERISKITQAAGVIEQSPLQEAEGRGREALDALSAIKPRGVAA
jgi:uncharacterized protein DUF6468